MFSWLKSLFKKQQLPAMDIVECSQKTGIKLVIPFNKEISNYLFSNSVVQCGGKGFIEYEGYANNKLKPTLKGKWVVELVWEHKDEF